MNNSRRNEIRNLAYKLIHTVGIETFPFNLFEITNNFKNIKVMSYKEASVEANCPIEDVSKFVAASDWAAISKNKATQKYLLLYNGDSRSQPIGRIRFSFAHELGHLFLGHLETNSAVLFKRLGTNIVENDELEQEANFFASELLVPLARISQLDKTHSWNISKLFDVSQQAASHSLHRFQQIEDLFKNTDKYFDFIKKIPLKKRNDLSTYEPSFLFFDESFFLVVHENIYFSFCDDCLSIDANIKKQQFCSVCGTDDICTAVDSDYFKFHENEAQKMYKYKEIPTVGSPSRIKNECPRCDNKIKITDNFCEVCSLYLINRCTGMTSNGLNINRQSYTYNNGETISINSETINQDFNLGCDTLQSGKARYCSDCGSVTTFYIQGLLEEWNKENSKLPF